MLECKTLSISKIFPVKRDLKAYVVKFALEKLCSADADVAGIAKYFITSSAKRGKMLAGLSACVIKKRESGTVRELKKLAHHNKRDKAARMRVQINKN